MTSASPAHAAQAARSQQLLSASPFPLLVRLGPGCFHPTLGVAVDAYLAEHAVDWKP
jgi:hypothetical protein